jgi:hypothetical protein
MAGQPLRISSAKTLLDSTISRLDNRLDLGPLFWFGSAPGKKLRPIDDYESPMRSTRNKDGERPRRKNHPLIPGDEFDTGLHRPSSY